MMKKKAKIEGWPKVHKKNLYNPDIIKFLKVIEREGSLSKAATKMNWSYKIGLEIVELLNHHSEEPLVRMSRVKKKDCEAEITPYGLVTIEQYDHLQKKTKELVAELDDLLDILKSIRSEEHR